MDKIQSLNPKSSMSVGLFFNNIRIVPIGVFKDLEGEVIQQWNNWIDLEKNICIETPRGNAVNMPRVRSRKFQIFLNILIEKGLLDGTNDTVSRIQKNVAGLIPEPIS